MNSKRTSTFLFSTIGVVAMLLIVVAVNFIFSLTNARLDLTEENLYTLSEGTRDILNDLDTPIEARFYVTQDDRVMPIHLKNYARQVENLLKEFANRADGNLRIRKLNPEPDSDAADSARLDGIQPQSINLGEQIYLGVAFSMLDQTAAIPFLSQQREQLLEYDLARAIASVMKDEKPRIGVMSALGVFGSQMNPMMARMGQQPQEAWILINELKRDFDVEEIPMSSETIPSDINVLLVIHPKQITDATQYAIDQFVMRGGNLIAFLDPHALIDQQQGGNQMMPQFTNSNMEKLLEAWGFTFDTSKVVADMTFARELSFQRGRPAELIPTFLFLTPEGINDEDVATAQLDDIWLPFPGHFSGSPAEGLEQTILLHSTEDSQLVDGFMAGISSQEIVKNFKADEKEYTLAMRLNGTFKTAFPDGKPATSTNDVDSADTTTDSSLSESPSETTVILVGDVDFASNNFSAQTILPGMYSLMNGNLSMVQSFVEQLGGDPRLIGARSKATMNRPFTRIREMERVAQEEYQAKINALEQERQEVQQRISELQRSREDSDQRMVLSPEQQQELQRFQERLVEANQELKDLRRNLRKDVDAMENWLKFWNIAGMPMAVVLVGLVVAVTKRKRTAAK